jgi:hypothetical protein
MGDHEDADYYEDYEGTDRTDLESRVADLENATEKNGSGSEVGCGAAFYSLGATLSVVISWEANHTVLWAVLHGFLSWFYVIYSVVAHSDKVKLL